MKIGIHRNEISLALLYLIVLLLVANCLGIVSSYVLGRSTVFGLVELFSFDRENNIPTLYSTLTLVFSCLMLLMIAADHRRVGKPFASWLFLSLVFFFLAIDETSSIHEQVGPLWVRMLAALNLSMADWVLIHYAWLVPYGLFVTVVFVCCARFLRALPRPYALLFMLAGTVYLTGAAGFEILGGLERGIDDTRTLRYAFLFTCEELLEMLGVWIFVYALLGYIGEFVEKVSFVFRS